MKIYNDGVPYIYITPELGGARQCVFASKDCDIIETNNGIKVIEPSGRTHDYPKGSYVFTEINNQDSFNIK